MMRMTRTSIPKNLTNVTPREFERIAREHLEYEGASLEDFRTSHLEPVPGVDGTYEIDVTARFRAMGVDFLVLAECKHQTSAIKRADVQVLRDKMQSTGAQKGILFASTGFQRGAIRCARTHRIALIRIADGATAVPSLSQEPGRDADHLGFVLWLNRLSADGNETWELIEGHDPSMLLTILGLTDSG